MLGASIVLAATWMYNQPGPSAPLPGVLAPPTIGLSSMREKAFEEDDDDMTPRVVTSSVANEKLNFRHATPSTSSQSLSSMIGLGASVDMERLDREREAESVFLGQMSRGNVGPGGRFSNVPIGASPYMSGSASPLQRSGSLSSVDQLSPESLHAPSTRRS